ncbi:MAG: hypothetical protein N3A54_04040, partial [Patescibacteria group bacterium]|nr:hypothetical protein [Patescibacteria group bacterium]
GKTTQNERDGVITTCESNASQKNFTYNVVNGVLQESRLSNGGYITISAYGLPSSVNPNSEACRNRNPTPTSIIEGL